MKKALVPRGFERFLRGLCHFRFHVEIPPSLQDTKKWPSPWWTIDPWWHTCRQLFKEIVTLLDVSEPVGYFWANISWLDWHNALERKWKERAKNWQSNGFCELLWAVGIYLLPFHSTCCLIHLKYSRGLSLALYKALERTFCVEKFIDRLPFIVGYVLEWSRDLIWSPAKRSLPYGVMSFRLPWWPN